MYELQWDPLAELYLSRTDWSQEAYCLCTRVFVRNKDERTTKNNVEDEFSASDTEFYKEEDVNDQLEEPIDNSLDTNCGTKHDVDTEVLSCYCSASHTDNISTDEHDSLRDSHYTRPILHKGLQSSDSGADLTEHGIHDPEAAWHKFWASHGERLIWDSWIAKYSDYINPNFLSNCDSESNECIEVEVTENTSNDKAELSKSKFSFDKKDIDKVEPNLSIIVEDKVLTEKTDAKNRLLIRNLSGSDSFDRLNTDISEGWNPLSPLSIDCETEAERLLSSRCGSYASGSVRTVDSMTNVTRMTISSIELSESSKTSESFSSVSSVQSSLSSTSSEDFDENADFDTQWNYLWKKHYEDEYLEQYKRYIQRHSGKIEIAVTSEVIKDDLCAQIAQKDVVQSMKLLCKERRNSNNSSVDDSESHSKRSKKRVSKKALDSVGQLLSNLKMEKPQAPLLSAENSMQSQDSNTKSTSIEESIHVDDCDMDAMNSMGLPLSFGTKTKKFATSKSITSMDSEKSNQSTSDRIKAAFNLMGIELQEANGPKFKGQVEYKMKHIRLQNRHLKLHNSNRITPKHTFFDEDGNEFQEDRESDEVIPQETINDAFDEKPSSSSCDETNIKSVESPLELSIDVEGRNDLTSVSRKKKRKRKLALPPEIKENPKLRKYWQKRFSLFNKFDLGIKLDEESWYSVTPEQVAKHTAERCKSDVIVDAFCGAGGNSIQFAFTCERVISIDIDPKKIELARNNAEIYGVADRIEFIVGDFFHLANSIKADTVFLSPPWGGPEYLNMATYELEEMLQPVPLAELLSAARKISDNVALFLPKNSNTYPLLTAAGQGGFVEIEQNFINKKLIAITAYYNDLIKQI